MIESQISSGVAADEALDRGVASSTASQQAADDPERTNNRVRLALVAASLLTVVSLAFLPWPALETLYSSGVPEEMPVLDRTIQVASVSGIGKATIAFAYVLVALLTLLIDEKINGRIWNFIAYSSLASLVGAIYLFVYVQNPTFSERFSNFNYVTDYLSINGASKANRDLLYGALQQWIYFGGIWNTFVFISMIKNKVAADFLKKVTGISI